ncbi:hypothetical protein JQ604_12090 [Bradyrhizobium jicamae]|uniref:hypothetical protein n=1 Tax=Bradyrhizobium jicamae TaxID=280332 RepID=UPI001BAC59F2|nr:hypothetical protein [Bradyrhizobium jicamae]MBR0752926.1 hypothetical protein [Bradyrhizobium jicamae]
MTTTDDDLERRVTVLSAQLIAAETIFASVVASALRLFDADDRDMLISTLREAFAVNPGRASAVGREKLEMVLLHADEHAQQLMDRIERAARGGDPQPLRRA